MTWDDLKERIGGRARTIIADDRCNGNDKPCCFMTVHKKGDVEIKWLEDANKFHCFDCSENWDVIDHARWVAHDDNAKAYEFLCEWAGVEKSDGSRAPRQKSSSMPMPDPIKPPPPINLKTFQPVTKSNSRMAAHYLQERGITPATIRAYKITSTDGAIYFNYLIGRDIVKIKGRVPFECDNGKQKYAPTVPGGSNVLYGQHLYENQRVLAVCEGELDALALFEGMKANGLDKKVLCSSIPSGSASTSWIQNSRAFIEKFEEVVLIPDNDDAGKKFLQKAASELMMVKKVSSFDLSAHDVNDVNDLLMTYGTSIFNKLLTNVKPFLPGYTVDLKELPKDPDKTPYHRTGFFMFDRLMRGLRLGEISLFSAREGSGKTSILRQIAAYNIRVDNKRVATLMGEESVSVFRDTLINQCFLKTNPEMFIKEVDEWRNYDERPSTHLYNMFDSQMADMISFFDCRHLLDKDRFKKVCDWIKYERSIHGTTLFMVDNLMKLTTGTGAEKLTIQGQIINTLYSLAKELAVHIILVAHPNKIPDLLLKSNNVSGDADLVNTVDNFFTFQRFDKMIDRDPEGAAKLRGQVIKNGEYDHVTAFIYYQKNRRYGKSGYIPMRYDSRVNLIYDLDKDGGIGYGAQGYTMPAREIAPQETTKPSEDNTI